MTTMNKMKYLALLAAFSASVCVAQTASTKTATSEPQVLNAVVAVVNNDVITTGELAERAHSAALNLRRQKIQLPPMPQLRAQVLEQLILERAISQRARETGIRVDDAVFVLMTALSMPLLNKSPHKTKLPLPNCAAACHSMG